MKNLGLCNHALHVLDAHGYTVNANENASELGAIIISVITAKSTHSANN